MPTRRAILGCLLSIAMLTGCDSKKEEPGVPPYRIQIFYIFYAEANAYLNTNHESADFASIRQLAESELFANSKVQVIDSSGAVLLDVPVRSGPTTKSVDDIAKMLNVPVRRR